MVKVGVLLGKVFYYLTGLVRRIIPQIISFYTDNRSKKASINKPISPWGRTTETLSLTMATFA
jgi:hypothetical protein